jgi:hypothetical protein
MKRTSLAGSILTSLALGLVGCDSSEPKHEPAPEVPVAKPGPPMEPGPVQPSLTPPMPPTGPSTTPAAPDAKLDTPKSEEKKEEPKLDPPK